jgi:hypothetical protein
MSQLTCKGYVNTFTNGVLVEEKRRTPAANQEIKAAEPNVEDNATGTRKIGSVTHVGTVESSSFVNYGNLTYSGGNVRIGKHVCRMGR